MKKISIPGLFGPTVLACVLLMVSACAGNKPYTIELMPSPDVYDDGAIDPFTDTGSVKVLPYNRINVTEASQATAGNGHGYFRRSPWASSDILITLAYGLSPTERGLVRGENSPIWAFPADYIERLRAAIIKANPDLKQALEEN